jgi:hypothetical protein
VLKFKRRHRHAGPACPAHGPAQWQQRWSAVTVRGGDGGRRRQWGTAALLDGDDVRVRVRVLGCRDRAMLVLGEAAFVLIVLHLGRGRSADEAGEGGLPEMRRAGRRWMTMRRIRIAPHERGIGHGLAMEARFTHFTGGLVQFKTNNHKGSSIHTLHRWTNHKANSQAATVYGVPLTKKSRYTYREENIYSRQSITAEEQNHKMMSIGQATMGC